MKMKNLLSLLLACAMLFAFAGCGQSTVVSEDSSSVSGNTSQASSGVLNLTKPVSGTIVAKADPAFAEAVIDFCFRIASASDTDTNSVCSPLSVLTALAMVANGASDATLTDFLTTLCPGLTLTELNEGLSSFLAALSASEKTRFLAANSVWLDPSRADIRDAFLDQLAAYYDAGIFEADFASPETVDAINGWVSEKTDGQIPSIVKEISEDSVMYLINALTFNAKWESPYPETSIRDSVFTKADGSTETVSMMYSNEGSRYITLGGAEGFIRPYSDSYSFVALLPAEGTDIHAFYDSISGRDFLTAVQTKYTNYDVYAGLPGFKIDFQSSLKNSLKALGLEKAFDPENDPLSAMGSGKSNDRLYISDVVHQATIRVDSEGTQAGAVTSVIIATEGAMSDTIFKQIILDRPFFFAIIENATSFPVFCGIYGG